MDTRKDVGTSTGQSKAGQATPSGAGLVNEWQHMKFSWLRIAEGEVGVKELAGADDNPRIVAYHQTTTLKATEDSVPWCSSFVNWCMEQAGYKGTKSAAARSWLGYGEGCGEFIPHGSIVVMKRKGGGHVGFKVGEDNFYVYVLGGNQADEVNVRKFAHTQVLDYRLPTDLSDDDDVVYDFLSRHEV